MKMADLFNNTEIVGVSVVIVTFNGRFRLKPTLEHLAHQEGIDFDWEVLLIDNNSNDGTADLVRSLWDSFKTIVPFRIITESKPGTMYARYSGIVNSKYRYMLFCDDDNWLEKNYVKNAFYHINKNNSISAIGGRGEPEFEEEFKIPEGFRIPLKSYGVYAQGNVDGDTTFDQGHLYTAGAILDRKWLAKLYNSGFKSVLTGRDGKTLAAGEDTELTIALKLLGGSLYYFSNMQFKHFMPNSRFTWDYVKRFQVGKGFSMYLLGPYLDKGYKSFFILDLLSTLKTIVRLYFSAQINNFKESDENTLQYYRNLGRLKAIIKSRSKFKMIHAWLETIRN
jgi:glycosyltransferase involved in cell wall biosynthesis